MCAFPVTAIRDQTITAEMLNAQLDHGLGEWIDKQLFEELDLFVSGSFFNPEEIPVEARHYAYKKVATLPHLKKLLVESRPEYIDENVIHEAKLYLGDSIRLEVAVGLESASDHVRENLLNKGFGKKEFEHAFQTLASEGELDLLCYLFLKPPGLSEKEALEDLVQSAKYLQSLANKHKFWSITAAVQPAFVQAGGPLEDAFSRGDYQPPWLWTIVEAIKRMHGMIDIQIGTAEDVPPPIAIRQNCGDCDRRVEQAIALYNMTHDISIFSGLHCECKYAWKAETGIIPIDQGERFH